MVRDWQQAVSSGVDKRVVIKRVVLADLPPNENRNEGTFGCSPRTKTGTRVRSHVPLERKPERGYVRKPPSYLPVISHHRYPHFWMIITCCRICLCNCEFNALPCQSSAEILQCNNGIFRNSVMLSQAPPCPSFPCFFWNSLFFSFLCKDFLVFYFWAFFPSFPGILGVR